MAEEKSWDGQERRSNTINFWERIHSIEMKLNTLVEQSKTRQETENVLIDQLTKMTSETHAVVFGDKERPGLREDINNLKRSEVKRQAHIMLLTAGVFAAMFDLIVNFFKTMFK